MDKNKIINLAIFGTASFVAGIIVNQLVVEHRLGKVLSSEALLYLAATDYVKNKHEGH